MFLLQGHLLRPSALFQQHVIFGGISVLTEYWVVVCGLQSVKLTFYELSGLNTHNVTRNYRDRSHPRCSWVWVLSPYGFQALFQPTSCFNHVAYKATFFLSSSFLLLVPKNRVAILRPSPTTSPGTIRKPSCSPKALIIPLSRYWKTKPFFSSHPLQVGSLLLAAVLQHTVMLISL